MILSKHLVATPLLALALAGLAVDPASASTDPLSTDAVSALVETSCQLDPTAPLTLEEMSPVVVAEADVDVVPGEISAHVVRAQVNTSAGDVQECTVGILHRDVQLKQVQHLGVASLDRVDTASGLTGGVVTEFGFGNMGKSSPIDPRTEVGLGGFLTPLENAVEDPTYSISVTRKSLKVVQIAVHRSEAKAAAKLLKRQLKAANRLLRAQARAAKSGHADKLLAAAQRTHDKQVAKAQARYERATTPKTVTRSVSEHFTATGTVGLAG